MADYLSLEQALTFALELARRPVAVAFRDTPPADTPKFAGTKPAGCSFWKLAADGRTFYTVPVDHYNCSIGSYTHNIPLPPEREQELPQTLSLMAEIGYVRMEEVAGIPRVPTSPQVVVYAPLGATPVDPDAVIITATPNGLMLLHEAAMRAGIPIQPMFGRPTCMAIPAAMSQAVVNSFGCVGNRVYTELAGGDLYSVIAGRDLPAIAEQLATIAAANATLREYHTQRAATLRT